MRVVAFLAVLAAVGCSGGGGEGAAPDVVPDVAEPDGLAVDAPDVAPDPGDVPDPGDAAPDDAAPDSAAPDDAPAADVPFEWPVETGPVAITPSPDWKGQVEFPDDPFLVGTHDQDFRPTPGWIKFAVLMRDPTRVYFQDGRKYPFHYGFATARLDPFLGMTVEEFDAISLHAAGQEVILGAVIFAPRKQPEYGIELVRRDPYHREMVRIVFDLVKAAVKSDGPVTAFCFPAWEQAAAAKEDEAWLAANGVPVSSADRWAIGNACYSEGWALGRFVHLPADQIAPAYLDGRLGPTDVLLADAVPAEVPFVAGIVSLSASTPNSHVAILAHSFGVPFAYLALQQDREAALALAGKDVALSVSGRYGGCDVLLADASGMPAAMRDGVAALKEVPEVQVRPKETLGSVSASTDDLGPEDVVHFGGKAAGFGLLRDAIPDSSPAAIAFSFDLWDGFLAQPAEGGGTVRQAIDGRLAGHAWPPDMGSLADDLAWVRALVEDKTGFAAPLADGVKAALDAAGFDPARKIRFRSSTNVEDSVSFVGAGLYDSFSGCLADDTDGDDAGPSACEAGQAKERGVLRAIKKVYASFWNLNAFVERLRRGVDEAEVGMGVLVHPSFPDGEELANGVAVLERRTYGTEVTISTQVGATSVANPDGTAQPEVVSVSIYDFGTYPYLKQPSGLVPLGGYVMAWEDDYKDLVELLRKVADRFAAVSGKPEFALDLEFKKMVPGKLWVKQVREIPRTDASASVPTLMLAGDVEWCLFQGEASDVFANHRLKSRWSARTRHTWVSEVAPAGWFEQLSWEWPDGTEVVPLGGDPAGFDGWAATREGEEVVHAWYVGSGPEGRALDLRAMTPSLNPPAEGPFLGQPVRLWLGVVWQTPQPTYREWEGSFGTTDTDFVELGPCTGPGDVTPAHPAVTRVMKGAGITVTARFRHPPPLEGATAGYTAPLVAWEGTTVEGLASVPIELTSWWAQTYRPQHHNFAEDFIFEPRLDPAVPASVVAELDALDVAAIQLRWGMDGGETKVVAIGLDGTPRLL